MNGYASKENYITRDSDPESWRSHANYHIIQSYKKLITGKCADLGCNHGSCTIMLAELPDTTVTGFDINESALGVARSTAKQYNRNITYTGTNLTTLPVGDDYFDFIMSMHTLEHIYPEDIDAVVSEMFRVLKPSGNVLISIPYDHAYPDPCHVAFYVESTLAALFENHGFITVECFKDDRFTEKNLLTAIFTKN